MNNVAQNRKFVVLVFLMAMTVANFSLLFRVIPKLRNGYQDFTIFYTGARLLRDGQASTLYDLATQYRTQQTFTDVPIRLGPLPFNHPPFEALLFIPFTLLPYWPAYLLWTALNFIMLAATLILLRRHFPRLAAVSKLELTLAATAFFPLAIGLIQGQDIILLLLFFVLAIIFLDQGKDVLAGVLLGAALFRPQTAVPLVVLLAARRWKVLAGFAPVALVLFGVSVVLMGWHGPFDYVHFVIHLDGTKASAFGPEAVPNLRGLVTQLPGVSASRPLTTCIIFASSTVVFLLTLRRIRTRQDSVIFSSSLAAITTILVSFHALVYDLSMLFPMLLFLLARVVGIDREQIDGMKPDTLTCLLFILLFLTPLYIYLLLVVMRFFWFSPILLWLYFRLLLAPAPAEVPA
jgi:Glycosyltransferase family 87